MESKPPTALPTVEVHLMNGEPVQIKPWSLKLGRLMRERITKMFVRAREMNLSQGDLDVAQLMEHFESEIYYIVRDTIDKSDVWMEEHLAYEDLFTLTQAVVDVCVLRQDGGGALGKILGAMGGAFGGSNLPPEIAARMDRVRAEARGDAPETPTPTSPEASPSSQGGGAQLPTGSPSD